MSILNVEHLTHGFGDRAIFSDVSFRLLKGEHIGLVGANGEGKSTFMSIVTGKLMPDEGKVEWAKNVRAGYLDQHAVLEKGMTIQEVLKSAFDPLLQKEQRMNEICDLLGSADEEEMNVLMEELGTIQDELTLHDFYVIDSKVEEVARALGLLDLGLDRDVTDLSGGQRTKVLLGKLLLEKPDILLLDEPTNYLDEEHIGMDKSMAEALGAKREMKDVKKKDLYNPWWNTLAGGDGTLKYRGKWNLFDQIVFTGNFLNKRHKKLSYFTHEIFKRDYLIQADGKYKGYPLRTQAGGRWMNGYSDHLPTVVYFIKK